MANSINHVRTFCLLTAAGLAALGTSASSLAQPHNDEHLFTKPQVVSMPADGSMPEMATDYRATEPTRAFVLSQKKLERQIRQVRARYLGPKAAHEPTRNEGLAQLESFTQPEAIEPLVETLGGESAPVQSWLVQHLRDRVDPEYGQSTLAYLCIYGDDASLADMALGSLEGPASARTRYIINKALHSRNHNVVGNAAIVAGQLKLFEAIPLLIAAQAGQAGGGGTSGTGDLAFIAIGTQRYFVSDLQPVVGEASAGFDPTISTIFEGSVVRIQDAVVEFKRPAVHNVLMGMVQEDFGKPVDFGYDVNAWREWYNTEYLPFKEAQLREQAEAESGQG